MQAVQIFTSLVLAAFAGYIGAWYFGAIEGNFALLLFLATAVTGAYWLAERFYFLPQRKRAAQAIEDAAAQRRAELDRMGIAQVDIDVRESKERLLMQPWWLDWTAGLFPVIAAVFVLRSFLFEPFKIPSGSMIPTLLVGDLILVNKFTYGVRLPVIHTKITEGNAPQRGDVVVFRYPPQPSLDYIKRVVGVPGDEVAYLNKRLTINGQPVPTQDLPDYLEGDSLRYFKHFEEQLGERAVPGVAHADQHVAPGWGGVTNERGHGQRFPRGQLPADSGLEHRCHSPLLLRSWRPSRPAIESMDC